MARPSPAAFWEKNLTKLKDASNLPPKVESKTKSAGAQPKKKSDTTNSKNDSAWSAAPEAFSKDASIRSDDDWVVASDALTLNSPATAEDRSFESRKELDSAEKTTTDGIENGVAVDTAKEQAEDSTEKCTNGAESGANFDLGSITFEDTTNGNNTTYMLRASSYVKDFSSSPPKAGSIKNMTEILSLGNDTDEVLRTIIKQLQLENAALKAEIEEERTENTLLRNENEKMALQLQQKSFDSMPSVPRTSEEDKTIISKLQDIQVTMRLFSKQVARSKMPQSKDFASSQQQSNFEKCLQAITTPDGLEAFSAISSEKQCATILNALLAHSVYTEMFQQPFALVGDCGTGRREGLASLYRDMCLVDQKPAHAWRAETLRLINPLDAKDDNDVAAIMCDEVGKNKVLAAKLRAEEFYNSPAAMLFRQGHLTRGQKNQLRDLFYRAGVLAYDIWTSKAVLEVGTLNHLVPSQYDADSPLTTLHPLAFKNDSSALTGRNICMVTHPLVRVWGTDDGEHYDQARLWMPAEVWFPVEKETAASSV